MTARRASFFGNMEAPSREQILADREERQKPPVIVSSNPFAESIAAEEKPETTPVEAIKILSYRHIQEWLEENGYGHVCEEMSPSECNPWLYEPAMMDALIKERIMGNDPKEIAEIRRLIYRGSWPSRSHRPTEHEVEKYLHLLRAQEQEKMQVKKVHADPASAKENKENYREIIEEFKTVEAAIREKLRGEALEEATRLIEGLHARAWLELKAVMAARGISAKKEILQHHHLTKDLFQEIERIRPVRDYLYLHRFAENVTEH